MTDAFEVVATDGVSADGLAPLVGDDRFAVHRFAASADPGFSDVFASASGLIVRSATKVDSGLFDRAPQLRVVGRAGVGVDNIDIDDASRRGIAVINAPGGNTVAAAELTIALILSVVRMVPEADRSIREGRWDRARFRGSELRGKTLGLVGAGRIGREVAIRCDSFGMDAIAYDPYLTAEQAEGYGLTLVDLPEVLAGADVISLHVPLNDETRGLIDKEALRSMKSSAVVVNASRGGVVDEAALAEALHQGEIGGAGLDVYETEPIPDDSPLLDAPSLVLTPHLGASTNEAQVQVAVEVAEGIRKILGEGEISEALNASQISETFRIS